MATPVVTVSFTVSVSCGISGSTTFNFTDTSTVDVGFKRLWLWDFGDGTISESQNPSHVYTGSPGQTYDVSLAVLATTGEFDALASGTSFATRNSNIRITGSDPNIDDAWDARAPAPLPFVRAEHNLNFNGASYSYVTNTPNLNLKSASSTPAYVLIEGELWVGIGTPDITGQVDIAGFVAAPSVTGTYETVGALIGLSNAADVVSDATPNPIVPLSAPTTAARRGTAITFRTRTYTNTSTQGYGESTEVEFVSLATTPVASFTAAPAAGPSLLSVQFTNTTTQSDCGPGATWSWKKRIAGSGDPFVEFSTQKNPTEIFTK